MWTFFWVTIFILYNLNKTSTGLLLSKILVIPPNVKLKEFQKRLIHHIANITHAVINCTQYQKQKTLVFMSFHSRKSPKTSVQICTRHKCQWYVIWRSTSMANTGKKRPLWSLTECYKTVNWLNNMNPHNFFTFANKYRPLPSNHHCKLKTIPPQLIVTNLHFLYTS